MNRQILEELKKITPEEKEILEKGSNIDTNIYTSEKNMKIDSKRLMEDGRVIQIRPHTRFAYFPKHTHNYVEVIYMCSGKMTNYINDIEVELQAGELLFLNQNATQEIMATGEEDVAVNFIILPQFFDNALNLLSEDEHLIRDFLIGCLKENDETSFLHFKVADILPVQNLVENLIYMVMRPEENLRSLDSRTMALLLLCLSSYTDKVEVGKNREEHQLQLEVLKYIEENYKEGELSLLADRLGYDISRLSRLIKKITGKNYTELVQNKRMNHAAYLLENTDLTVADIILNVGYDNFSYFHRAFKKKYGMSPRQYRTARKKQ